jgi:hypothetical protein
MIILWGRVWFLTSILSPRIIEGFWEHSRKFQVQAEFWTEGGAPENKEIRCKITNPSGEKHPFATRRK